MVGPSRNTRSFKRRVCIPRYTSAWSCAPTYDTWLNWYTTDPSVRALCTCMCALSAHPSGLLSILVQKRCANIQLPCFMLLPFHMVSADIHMVLYVSACHSRWSAHILVRPGLLIVTCKAFILNYKCYLLCLQIYLGQIHIFIF